MAKASSLADTLGKHLECAVCLEQYTEPKVLPCLHTFCKQCLQGLLTQEGDVSKINCPSCRSFAEIPQGQVDLLPVNFFVDNLLAVVALHNDSESGNLECDVCESGDPPVNRCATCLHFLCEFCSQAHRRGRGSSSHSLLSLEEAKKIGSVSGSKPSFCKEHEEEVIKLFCETCSEAICRDCTIVNHRDHKYTFVRDAFPRCKENLTKLLSETKRKLSKLKEALDSATDMKTRIHSSAEQTTEEVIKCFDELTALVDTRRTELISHINKVKEAKLRSLAVQQQELETAQGWVQSGVEFTENAFENGSEVDILNMHRQISSRLRYLTLSQWQLEPCVDEGFNFRDDNLSVGLKHEISKFCVVTGEVTDAAMSTVTMEHGQEGVMYNTLCGQPVKFTISARTQNGAITSKGGDIFNVQIDSDDAGMVSSMTVHFNSEKGMYCFSHTPEKEGLYSMSVMLNGHHLQNSPFTWFIEKWTLQPFLSGNVDVHIQEEEEKLTASYLVHCNVPGGSQHGAKMTARTFGTIGTLLGVNISALTGDITFGTMACDTTTESESELSTTTSPSSATPLFGAPTGFTFGTAAQPLSSGTGSSLGMPFGALSCTTSSASVPSSDTSLFGAATGFTFGIAAQPLSSGTGSSVGTPFGALSCTTSSASVPSSDTSLFGAATGFTFGIPAQPLSSGTGSSLGMPFGALSCTTSSASVPSSDTSLFGAATGFTFGIPAQPLSSGTGSSLGMPFGALSCTTSSASVPSSDTSLFGAATKRTGSLFGTAAQPFPSGTGSPLGATFGATSCTTSSSTTVPSSATPLFDASTVVPTFSATVQPPSSGTGFSLGTTPCTTTSCNNGLLSTSRLQLPTCGTAGLGFQTQPSTDDRPVLPSIGFSSGTHMWKVKIHGNVMEGFSFGIINVTRKPNDRLAKLGIWWAWNSHLKQYPLPSGAQSSAESTITNCASGDIIELYLDHEDGTLKMYNPRTKQSDIWGGVKGEVLPVFHMTAHGDKISLKLQ